MKSSLFILCITALPHFSVCGQSFNNPTRDSIARDIFHLHISDVKEGMPHEIHMLNITNLEESSFAIAYSDSVLIPTSDFAKRNNAIAAINGGFFDIRNGGSVTYLEVNGEVINWSRKEGEKGAISNQTMNGVIKANNNGEIQIEMARSEDYYYESMEESFVLVTGPVLVIDGTPAKLPDTAFSNNRHPRSCLCVKEESVMMILVDGRSDKASGMSLPELQGLLINQGCVQAINLDGGGSSTLWINSDGGQILNNPSDKTGERSVANAIIVLHKN